MLPTLNPHARNAVLYGFAMFMPRAVAFLLLPVYTRWLLPSEFGTFTLLNAGLNILRLALVLGFVGSIIWSLTYRKTDPGETLGSAITFLSAASVVGALLIMIGAPWICDTLAGGTLPVSLLRIVAATAAIESVEQLSCAFFRSQAKAGRFAMLGAWRFTLDAGLKIVFLVGLHRGVAGLIEAGLITSAMLAVLSMWFVRKDFKPVFSWPIVREMLRFGLPLIPVQLAFMSQDVADRYILNHFTTPFVVGVYSLGYNVGIAVTLITQTLQLGWVPQMYKLAARLDAGRLIGRLTTGYTALLAFAGLGLAVFGGDLIRLMAAPSYYGAIAILPVIVLAYIIQSIAYFTNVGISVRNLNHVSAIIAISGAVLNIVLNFILIPRMGMMGAVWSTLISAVALSVGYISVNQRLLPIHYEVSRIIRIATVTLALFAVALYVDSFALAPRLIAKSILLATFPVLLLLSGVVTRAEIASLRAFITSGAKSNSVQSLEKPGV